MIKLAYGEGFVEFDEAGYPNCRLVKPPAISTADAASSLAIVTAALENPYDSPGLEAIARQKQARTAVIIVNDITRPTPYLHMLPPLVAALNRTGIADQDITLLVATGIHRPHTEEDNIFCYGAEMCQRLQVVNHDCDRDLLEIGVLSNGIPLRLNRRAVETDLLISTGLISLHYIAGYSGGRKSILPGIAGRDAIEASHKLMNDSRACLGRLGDNPVHQLMLEAAGMSNLDFILNVEGSQSRVYSAYAGHYHTAWLAACGACEKSSMVTIHERGDVVIASCGGYPKDINVYQAQKALDTAALAVKPGGTIIWLAECREGLGEEVFSDWIKSSTCPADIKERFHRQFELGGHKAFAICRILEKADIIMISALPPAEIEELYVRPAPSIEQALQWVEEKHGNRGMTILIMPEAPKTAVNIE